MQSVSSRFPVLKVLLLLLVSIQTHAIELTDPKTALQSYINQDDGMFSIQHVVSIPGPGYTAHLYNLTSQKWLTEAEVDKTVWTHSLVIIVPATVSSTTGLLYVGGDNNTDPLPGATHPTVQVITQLALASQSIVSAVFQVPNQPITFAGQAPSGEDALVAYSWLKAMNTGNYLWPAYLPMTKSVIKAMDGIQQVTSGMGYSLHDFVLTGFSKRGAAVWLTATVDPRVRAIAPGVIDFLNITENFEHHYKSYGSYSPAIDDYVGLGITGNMRSPEFRDLAQVIDPYHSLNVLTMPKFLLNSSGDEFFLPDSSRFYFDDLPGEKLIRFAPNTSHSLNNSVTGVADTLYSLLGWYQTVLYNLPRPELHWSVNNGVLSATTSLPPLQVRLWQAHNPLARDFRKDVIGESWTATSLLADANGEYSVSLADGSNGYNASYIEFVYSGLTGQPVTYSTQVYVTPDIEPYTLTDAVVDPKSSSYWLRQVRAVLSGNPADVDADTLNSYLPLPLFDAYVNNLDDVEDALVIRHEKLADGMADRECVSTRLNIERKQLGWHSHVNLGWYSGNKELWEYYKIADDAADNGYPLLSAFICEKLNSL
jgi:PhoPQ-activated pathogenicity-related protein